MLLKKCKDLRKKYQILCKLKCDIDFILYIMHINQIVILFITHIICLTVVIILNQIILN